MNNTRLIIIIGLIVLLGCSIVGVSIIMNDTNDTTTINPDNEQDDKGLVGGDPVSINMNLGSGALTTGTLTTGKFCMGSTCIDEVKLKILGGGTPVYLRNLSGGKGPLQREKTGEDVGTWGSAGGNATWHINTSDAINP